MAMFPTHIRTSTIVGIGGGLVAYVGYGVPFTTSCVGAGMCAIGGILPDIDSGPGIPLREITTFLASVVPTMLIARLLSFAFTQETLILTGAILYVGIRFGLSHFLRHYTVHRGMFHSFPTMAIFGELVYLLFYGESMFIRIFMTSAVCLGVFVHLLLDEIYSVEWDGKPRLKKSFGTAMKFAGDSWWPNVTCYAKLAVLTYFVIHDPAVIHQLYTAKEPEVAKEFGQSIKDRFDSIAAIGRPKSSASATPYAMISGGPAGGQANVSANPRYATAPAYSAAVTAQVPAGAINPAAANSAPPSGYSQAPTSPPANNYYSQAPSDPPTGYYAAPGNRTTRATPAALGPAPKSAENRPWAAAPAPTPPSNGRFWQ